VQALGHHVGMDSRLPRWAALALAASLSACNLGLSFGYGPDDDPPSVSLAASPTTAPPGAVIGLVAAANDDYVVSEVRFYRVDATGSTLLGRDRDAPFALETVLPAGAATEVRYFARAVDDADQATDSEDVVVVVR
jgi:hypothetical protein